jgi:hypothetical protein
VVTGCQVNTTTPVAVNGHLDLSNWNFNNSASVALNGQWYFYPRQLSPGDISDPDFVMRDSLITLPDDWNRIQLNSEQMNIEDDVTFRLLITLPANQNTELTLMSDIISDHCLWINGKLLQCRGEGWNEVEVHSSHNQFGLISLPRSHSKLDLLLRVSNFKLARLSEVLRPVYIGERSGLEQEHLLKQILDIVVISSLWLLGLYFLFRSLVSWKLLNRMDAGSIWFAVICSLWGGYTLFMGVSGHLILDLLPQIEKTHFFSINYLLYYLGVPATTVLISILFPKESIMPLNRLWISAGILFSLSVLFFQLPLFARVIRFYEILVAVQLGYVCWVLYRSLKKSRDGVWPLFIGMMVVVVAAVNDILLDNFMLDSIYLSTLGILALVSSQAYVLLMRSVKDQSLIRHLSNEVREKTKKLQQAHDVTTTENHDDIYQAEPDISLQKRRLTVEVINSALDLWVLETRTSKAELARLSGFWKVYLNSDGWYRTQTLDRYLKLETLPTHPHINTVLQTVEFVLEKCPNESQQRTYLLYTLNQLRQLL